MSVFIIIVQTDPRNRGSEVHLCSVTAIPERGVQKIRHMDRETPVSQEYQYPGRPANPDDFCIVEYPFTKRDGRWFYRPTPDILSPVVHGGDALEAYGSGEMFARPQEIRGAA